MMLSRVFFTLLAVVEVCSSAAPSGEEHDLKLCRRWPAYCAAFETFVTKYSRSYSDEAEKERRFNIFKTNYQFIEDHNSKQKSYVLQVNKFTDLTPDEFASSYMGGFEEKAAPPKGVRGEKAAPPKGVWGADAPLLGTHRYSGKSLPDSVDWVAAGAVTPVEHQGDCQSCWAFSATGALEGAWFKATGNLVSLSKQELVDCLAQHPDSHQGNFQFGCQPGNADSVFEYVKNTGAVTAESYPYMGVEQSCGSGTIEIPAGAVTGFYNVPKDPQSIMEAVAQQPVSVVVQSKQAIFQSYSGGIITGDCDAATDHVVLIVGYGTENGIDYWTVKNSWGTDWGEAGYVRIERNVSQQDGQCGIRNWPTYPILSAPNSTGTSAGRSLRGALFV